MPDQVSVRRTENLPLASLRFHLTIESLALANASHYQGEQNKLITVERSTSAANAVVFVDRAFFEIYFEPK
jgi:hypothetical protein